MNPLTLGLIIVLIEFGRVESADKDQCIKEGDFGCIQCDCDSQTGFSSCKPHSCPPAINTEAEAIRGEKTGECRFGTKFKAQCVSCDCTGSQDHCAMCAALPIKRVEQTSEVNEKLPWINDQRFFNYEVNGWERDTD